MGRKIGSVNPNSKRQKLIREREEPNNLAPGLTNPGSHTYGQHCQSDKALHEAFTIHLENPSPASQYAQDGKWMRR